MLYIVSYDIPDNKRRTRLAKMLLDFGDRAQFSVFECILNKNSLEELKNKIQKIILEKDDRVRIYPICAACQGLIEIYGKGRNITNRRRIYCLKQ